MRVGLRRGWLVWAQWCAQTGRTSLAVTEQAVAEFVSQVGEADLEEIAATCREKGIPSPWDDHERAKRPSSCAREEPLGWRRE